MKLLLLSIIGLGVAVMPAQDNAARMPQRSTVRSHGQASVSVKPDQVRVDVGVVSQAPTAQAAGAQNAKQLADVLAELKKALGPAAEIRTTNYSLQPLYKSDRTGSAPVIVGYSASNTVQVKLDEVAAAGKIIDVATKTGANNIHGVYFTVKDEQRVRAEALKQAAAQARTNADAIASALGLKAVRILSVDDGQPVIVQPLRQMMDMGEASAMRAAVPTPVEPGSIEVRATVTVTVEVAP
jgi:uncharacterized protein YggE